MRSQQLVRVVEWCEGAPVIRSDVFIQELKHFRRVFLDELEKGHLRQPFGLFALARMEELAAEPHSQFDGCETVLVLDGIGVTQSI